MCDECNELFNEFIELLHYNAVNETYRRITLHGEIFGIEIADS